MHPALLVVSAMIRPLGRGGWGRTSVLILFSMACGRVSVPLTKTQRPAIRSERTPPTPEKGHVTELRFCPSKTKTRGAAPPNGDAIWCVGDDGKNEGPYRTWHDNGVPESAGQYRDGRRVGVWRYWTSSGDLKRLAARMEICVFEKKSRRSLTNLSIAIQDMETTDTTFATTDGHGVAAVWVEWREVRIAIVGSLYLQAATTVDTLKESELVRFELDEPVVRDLLQANVGARLSNLRACET